MFSTPLSLRLWCMAAMAPALTEAAAQPRSFKLPPTTPTTTDHEGAQASSRDSPDSGHPVDLLTSPLRSQSLVSHREFIQQNGNSHRHLSATPRVSARTFCTNFDPQKLRKNLMGETLKSTIQLVNGNSNYPHSNTMNNNSSKTHTGTVCSTTKFNNVTSLPLSTMSPQTPTTGTPTPSPGSLASPGPTTTTEAEARDGDILDMPLNKSGDIILETLSHDNSEHHVDDEINNDEGQMNTNQNNNQTTPKYDPSVISGQTMDSSRKQQQLQKRASLLLKRIRRLQYKQVDGHLHQQMGGLLEQQNQQILATKEMLKTSNSNSDSVDSIFDASANTTTPTLLGLVQQLDKDSTALTNSSLSRTLSNRTTGSHYTLSSTNKKFRKDVRDTSNLLKAGVKHLQFEIDSDATESSSGESCDEDDAIVNDNKGHTHVPVHRRALWKWAVDRAAVACRWTWLQAQVSDLEYRIRQQTDIYRQVRATKGLISLGEQSPPDDLMKLRTSRLVGRKLSPIEAKIAKLESRNDMSPSNLSTLMSNVDRQTAKINQSLQNFYSPVQKSLGRSPLANTPIQGKLPAPTPMNGFVESAASHGNQLLDSPDSQDSDHIDSASKRLKLEPDRSSPAASPDWGSTAARTRPILFFRRRKLLRSLGIHQTSRKAQKLSSVRCGCCMPVTPCVICSGRYNNTQTIDPDVMPLSEKVSLLDYSYHPVLSFPQDIPLSVHYEGLLKSGEWQNRPPPKSPMKKKSHLSHSQQVRRANHKLAKSAAAALLSSAKLRIRVDNKTFSRSRSHPSTVPNTPKRAGVDSRICRTDVKKRRAAQLAMSKFALKKSRNRALSLPSLNNKSLSSPTTPVNSIPSKDSHLALSSSMPANSLQAYLRKRRGENAFDINNIVIPYSMAASTRVERLKYKEILTPKWRKLEVEEKGNETTCAKNEEGREIEDLSDELLTERHLICEIAERKRYLGYVHKNKRGSRGSRANSGSGTPEPCSPDISHCESSLTCVLPNRANLTPSPINTPPPESKVFESIRRRTISASSDKSTFDRLQSSKSLDLLNDESEDGFTEIIPPWPEREFPLNDPELDALEGSSPPPSPIVKREIIPTAFADSDSRSETSSPVIMTSSLGKNSRTATPDFDNDNDNDDDESTDDDIEDPNDPEWTVIKPDIQKTAIVLKLAKR